MAKFKQTAEMRSFSVGAAVYSLKRGPQRKANAKAIPGIEMDCWRFPVRTRRACSREHRNLFAITWRRQRRLLSLWGGMRWDSV